MSLVFKGISSDTMKFNVTSREVYSAPEYDLNAVEVPGRSGDVLNPQNRYKNKAVKYTGFIRTKDFQGNTKREALSAGLRAIKGWLLSDAGAYHDLTDDYDPGYTRRAYIYGETAITDILDRADGAEFTITFSAAPFMYGPAEQDTEITGSGAITNPNEFASLPLIAITMSGAGTMTIGNRTWQIGANSGTLYVDSEAMDWYTAGALKNGIVEGDGFPVLQPGANNVSMTGGISKVTITPRWRTL